MVHGLEIKVTGATEFINHNKKMVGSLEKISDEEVGVMAKWFESRIKRNAQIMVPHIYRQSGELERSIKQRKIDDKSYVIEMADFGIMLDQGSRPHTIKPKNASVLHWHRFGEDHYAHEVYHPGNKPYLFLTSALLETNTQTKQFGYNLMRRIKSFYK